MQNINLNAGGFIGAFLVGGIAGAVLFSMLESDRAAKLSVGALVFGAISGNTAWSYLFPLQGDEPNSDLDENEQSNV